MCVRQSLHISVINKHSFLRPLMWLNVFSSVSSCRLFFPARLPLSQLSGGAEVTPFEEVEQEIKAMKRALLENRDELADLKILMDGITDKQKWQELHKEKLLLLKVQEQLREEELLFLKKMPYSSTPVRGHIVCACISIFQSTPCSFFSLSLAVSSQHAVTQVFCILSYFIFVVRCRWRLRSAASGATAEW